MNSPISGQKATGQEFTGQKPSTKVNIWTKAHH